MATFSLYFTSNAAVLGFRKEQDRVTVWANRLAVIQQGNVYEFYIWDEAYSSAVKIMTIFALTGEDRDEEAIKQNRVVLYAGETVTYAVNLEVASAAYHITQDTLQKSFHLIHHDWKNGET